MGRDPREEWGRQLISSMTIGAPCALRKLQKGEGTMGNGQEPLAAVGDAGGSAMAKGNDGGGDLELAARDRRDGAEGPGAHDVAQDAGLGAEVVPGRRGHGLSVLKGLRGRWGRLAPKLQGLAADAAAPRRRDFAWGLCVDPCGRRGRANSSSVCFFGRS